MNTKTLCCLVATLASISLQAYVPSEDPLTRIEAEHIKHIVRSVDNDGHSIATLYGMDIESGTHRSLTSHDIYLHAEQPSEDENLSFMLLLWSGRKVFLSLRKRTVLTFDTAVVEYVEGGRDTVYPGTRDCYFSGTVAQDGGGLASFAFCDGKVMGSFQISTRLYEVHPLPQSAKIRRPTDVHVLITWTDAEHVERKLGDGLIPPKEEETSDVHNISASGRKATIEVATYLNSAFLKKVNDSLLLSTSNEVIDFIVLKWSGVAAMYSDKQRVGWDMSIKLLLIEIWRENPEWFKSSNATIQDDMNSICTGAMNLGLKYDHVNIETYDTEDTINGVAWINTMCIPRFRCSATKGIGYGYHNEAHQLGHSLGLNHDNEMKECVDKRYGFMGGNPNFFRDCYRQMLKRTIPTKNCLFRDDVPASKQRISYLPISGPDENLRYAHEKIELDAQCKAQFGEEFMYVNYPGYSVCDRLSCLATNSRKPTYGQLMEGKVLDGTPCGEGKLCLSGRCITWDSAGVNRYVLLVHVTRGGWGLWSQWSLCNRPCGVAVRVSSRKCVSPVPILSAYCNGSMFKAEICPDLPACLGESLNEAKLVQQRAAKFCESLPSAFNLTRYRVRYYSFGTVDKCTIHCRYRDGTLSGKYILQDGTSCYGMDTDIDDSARRGISWNCVRGQCMAFGCDGKTLIEGGGKELDKCGLCGGTGASCS